MKHTYTHTTWWYTLDYNWFKNQHSACNTINLGQTNLFHSPTCSGFAGLSSGRKSNISENY